MTLRSLAAVVLASVLATGATSCGTEAGAVELAWVFVDRDGDPIYPGGVFTLDAERDSCGLPGMVADSETPYDLRVELEICDPTCAAGCDDDECLVIPRHVFPCNTARGNEPAVPASDEPYRFSVRAVLSAPSIDVECRDPACLAIPAPRERLVRAGLVTDLHVQQIVVDVDRGGDEALGLEACGCV